MLVCGWGSGQCASGSELAGSVCWDQQRLPAGKREVVGWRSPRRLDKLRGGNKNNIIGIREPLVCLCVCVYTFMMCNNLCDVSRCI